MAYKDIPSPSCFANKKICPLEKVELGYAKGFPVERDKPKVLRQESLNVWFFFNGRWE